jgi:excisionase family DNA binding protein
VSIDIDSSVLPSNRAARRHPEAVSATRRWASIADTATYLKITTRTVKVMIADGRLTAYHLGPRIVRLDLREVDKAMVPYGGAVS